MEKRTLPPILVAVVGGTIFLVVALAAPPDVRPFALGAMAVFLGISVGLHALEIRRWRAASHALNLTLEDSGWFAAGARLVGVVGGREVSLESYTRGSGKNSARWMRARLRIPRADPAFRLALTPEDLGAKVAKLFGGEDLQVDDPAFDRAFRIRSNDAVRARRLLDPLLREELLASAGKMELMVEDGEAVAHRRGGIRNTQSAEAMLHVAARLAQAAENAARQRA